MRRGRRRLPDSIVMPAAWRRGWPGLVLLLVFASVAVFDRARPDAAPSVQVEGDDVSRYHDKTFKVVHVVDGDTIDIDAPDGTKGKTRIRLWGVDTPEVAHNRGESDMHFGPEARDFAKRKLDQKDAHVVLWANQSRDKFGRLLAYVYVERGGEMFNQMLIEEGLAYSDWRFEHPFKNDFRAAEEKSRKAKAGLWAGVKVEQMPKWRQKRERRGGIDD